MCSTSCAYTAKRCVPRRVHTLHSPSRPGPARTERGRERERERERNNMRETCIHFIIHRVQDLRAQRERERETDRQTDRNNMRERERERRVCTLHNPLRPGPAQRERERERELKDVFHVVCVHCIVHRVKDLRKQRERKQNTHTM